LDWASDLANNTVIRAVAVAFLAAAFALWAIYQSWVRRPDTLSLINAIAKQNLSLHATIRKIADQTAAIEVTMQAWTRLQAPVRWIDAAAADLAQRAVETSNAYLMTGDTDAAKGLFRDLWEVRRETAVLLAQSQSLATLLERRLDYLHRSDAEMGNLVRELMQTRSYRRFLLPPPKL
jgi:hypothetical protein